MHCAGDTSHARLVLGIVFVPIVFAWLTLRTGYLPQQRLRSSSPPWSTFGPDIPTRSLADDFDEVSVSTFLWSASGNEPIHSAALEPASAGVISWRPRRLHSGMLSDESRQQPCIRGALPLESREHPSAIFSRSVLT